MKKRVLFNLLAVLAIAGGGYGAWVTWGVKAEAPVVQTVEAPKPLSEDELYNLSVKGVIDETNKYRATKGLAPLVESPLLDKSACLKADDMIAKDYWSHVSPDGTQPWYWFDQARYNYVKAGENLGKRFINNRVLVTAWIKSPTHEENLSGDYTEVGICVENNVHYLNTNTNLIVAHYGRLH